MNLPSTENPPSNPAAYSAFWPVLLIGVSFGVLMAQQLAVSLQQRRAARQLREQQAAVVRQAVQAEETLRTMMMELLTLAETDPDARRIAETHRIKFTPAAQPAPPVAPPR